MPDREKVISEFEKWCDAMEDECPVICLDAIALLKEQEAVKAIKCSDDRRDELATWWYACSSCRNPIDYKCKFCSECGRAVKWDD